MRDQLRIGEYSIEIRKHPLREDLPVWRVDQFYSGATGTYAQLIKVSDPKNLSCCERISEIFWQKFTNLTHPGEKPVVGDHVLTNEDYSQKLSDAEVVEVLRTLKV